MPRIPTLHLFGAPNKDEPGGGYTMDRGLAPGREDKPFNGQGRCGESSSNSLAGQLFSAVKNFRGVRRMTQASKKKKARTDRKRSPSYT